MPSRPGKPKSKSAAGGKELRLDAPIRIIGGELKNKKLLYSGEEVTRPMKERVRASVFNLVGPSIKEKHAIDLFAGTGALGIEALSRGAVSATFIERHIPTSKLIRQNLDNLGLGERSRLFAANTFFWAKRLPEFDEPPWVVFCSPPYELFISQADEMLALIQTLLAAAPPESIFVVESDQRFDFASLPYAEAWDVRTYAPAVVGILRDWSEAAS
ncbi:RsmD family RNA methyltransferase [Blastopirellula retiformator]|uniref:Ribosomal RNA small subunit methyltransferase D n=1 Tax=Blastopirellula retiformator TaxID=2527970 RepID=A0A5C5VNE3_9BACT|nr:RsmD family RNA methyltransferase [Blastopirellula retiformator]TWT39597.1 Ribosomal RNA small subunit methyltransferase D [Blastopirellula retiformator]